MYLLKLLSLHVGRSSYTLAKPDPCFDAHALPTRQMTPGRDERISLH